MPKVFLGLGSNVGDRLGNLKNATKAIQKDAGIIQDASTIIETHAWGKTNQSSFLNQVLKIETKKSAFQLLEFIDHYQSIHRNSDYIKWGPRTIDIDILYYDSYCIFAEEIELPHPFIAQRKFVLHSLAEIAPNWRHPILREDQISLLNNCTDKTEIVEYLNASH